MTDFKEKYKKEVVPQMMRLHNYASPLAVPRLVKVVINTGIGRIRDEKEQEIIAKNLALISAQKPTARPAKKAIASFKTRQGMTIGLAVTLRGQRMYDFLTRFINVALPRTRDFRGLEEKSVDEKGKGPRAKRRPLLRPLGATAAMPVGANRRNPLN